MSVRGGGGGIMNSVRFSFFFAHFCCLPGLLRAKMGFKDRMIMLKQHSSDGGLTAGRSLVHVFHPWTFCVENRERKS